MNKTKVLISFYNWEITVREAIVAVAIVAIWLIFGWGINEKIDDHIRKNNAEYTKALKVSTTDEFLYGMETDIGNAFVYGNYSAIDPVSYEEVDGEYTYLEKVKKKYTRHTRTVTKTRTVNGKTQTYTTTEVYYSWDVVNREHKSASKINFCGVEFDLGKIALPSKTYIKTIKESSNIKYEYYGIPEEMVGTIYTKLSNNTITDDSMFLQDQTPLEALETMKTSGIFSYILFWTLWTLLLGGVLYGWFYLDNRFLE